MKTAYEFGTQFGADAPILPIPRTHWADRRAQGRSGCCKFWADVDFTNRDIPEDIEPILIAALPDPEDRKQCEFEVEVCFADIDDWAVCYFRDWENFEPAFLHWLAEIIEAENESAITDAVAEAMIMMEG